MKKYYALIILVLSLSHIGIAQCPGISFYTQGQIDSFSINFPSCTTIDGSLELLGDSITNLAGLQMVERVNGSFITGRTPLIDFSGLENLKYIGGDFVVGSYIGTPDLSFFGFPKTSISFEGLESLDTINGTLYANNVNFTDFTGLSGLKSAKGIQLLRCEETINFDGLDQLSSLHSVVLGKFLLYQPGIQGSFGNSKIKDFSGLSGVNNLKIIKALDCPQLQSFSGLNQLTSIQTLQIESCPSLHNFTGLNNLVEISGKLQIGGYYEVPGYVHFPASLAVMKSNIENFTGLENVQQIGTFKVVNDSSLVDFSGLENLHQITNDFIAGELVKYSLYKTQFDWNPNAQLQSFNGLSSLEKIGGSFHVEGISQLNDFAGLSSLDSIGKDFILCNNTIQSLSTLNVKFIGGGVKLGSYYFNSYDNWKPALSDLSKLSFLDSIHGDLEIIDLDDLTGLDGLNNIQYVAGDLSVSGNGLLADLTPLHNITKVGGSLTIGEVVTFPVIGASFFHQHGNPQLVDLQGLESLVSVGKNLEITANANMVRLNGIQNLSKVGGHLNLGNRGTLGSGTPIWIGNSKLTDISPLSQIDSVDILTIIGNHSLTNLYDLNPDLRANEVFIQHNNHLSACGIPPICASKYEETLTISNNANGCNNEDELNCDFQSITGTIFFDANQNKIQDSLEWGIPNQKVIFTNLNHINLTNSSGLYFQQCDSGSIYNFSWMPDDEWLLTTDSASYTQTFFPDSISQNHNKHFGLFPKNPSHQFFVAPSLVPRCNTVHPIELYYGNKGSFMETGKIVLTYDSKVTFINNFYPPLEEDTASRQVTIYFDSVYPFQVNEINLPFLMPDENSSDEPIHFSFETYRDSAGTDILLSSDVFDAMVKCSFDPNDKQVMPNGQRDEHYTLHDQKLTYTIRFQNTGNAEAIDITIRDTVDADLDISTLRIVNSSFPVQTTLDGQAVEFLFKNIGLADSTHNEPESHGFVTYEIRPQPGLADYTEIKNTAYIVFDLNEPVITNTTTNTMVTAIPVQTVDVDREEISIRPNPAHDIIYLSTKSNKPIDKILIYNMLGELIVRSTAHQSSVDVRGLAPGMYILKLNMDGQFGVKSFIIE